MPKFTVTVIKTERTFWRTEVDACEERDARRIAIRKAKKAQDNGEDVFCDNEPVGFRAIIHR
jgi:hypothetical protein